MGLSRIFILPLSQKSDMKLVVSSWQERKERYRIKTLSVGDYDAFCAYCCQMLEGWLIESLGNASISVRSDRLYRP